MSAHPKNFGRICKDENADERAYPFVLQEHKLGIAFWAVAPIYGAARDIFHPLRDQLKGVCSTMLPRLFWPVLCFTVLPKFVLLANVFELSFDSPGPPDAGLLKQLLQATRTLVLVNADNYTAWNCRYRHSYLESNLSACSFFRQGSSYCIITPCGAQSASPLMLTL